MRLEGAVVVVTGASSGIGGATAAAFARHGATLVLAARRIDRLEALADRIERAGGTALAVRCDVTDAAQVTSLASVVDEAFGGADVLVNNAGVPSGPFADLDVEGIDRVVRVNLLGVLYGTHAFLPGMRARGRGHLVNVASLAGRFATPGGEVYSATKHAVVAFSEALHVTTSRSGVLVTAVNPAFVETESFTTRGLSPLLTIDVDDVAATIVRVVRDGIAPERSIPRWIAGLQVFRVLTPPLYRWGVRTVRRVAVRRSSTR